MRRGRKAAIASVVCLLAGLVACESETGLKVGHFITQDLNPVHWISEGVGGMVTHSEYMDIEHRTHPDGVTAKCAVSNGLPLAGDGSDPEDTFRELAGEACGCHPWGDCVEGMCSCETLCPNDFEIFTRPHSYGAVPNNDNSFDFINSSDDFNNSADFKSHPGDRKNSYGNSDGYCTGIAAVSRDFNYLAFFKGKMDAGDPPVPEPRTLKDGSVNPAWFKYYKSKVDDVLDGKAVDIPGYESLHDFSSDSIIKDYLLKVSAEEWARRSIDIGEGAFLHVGSMNHKDFEAFTNQVRQRKRDHQTALVTFNADGFGAHTVEGYDVQSDPKGSRICVRDPNCPGIMNAGCTNYFQLDDKSGKMRFHEMCNTVNGKYVEQWNDVSKIHIDHTDESDQVKYFHSLRAYCQKDHQCPLKD